jgi:hypothetical protein
MKLRFCVFCAGLLLAVGCMGGMSLNEGGRPSRPLRFRADKTFTIVQFTDTHFGFGDAELRDDSTYALMDSILRWEKPNLIVLTGDIVRYALEPQARPAWLRLISHLDSTGVPWAFVHGNHDAEVRGYAAVDSLLATSRNCLYSRGPDSLTQSGNYVMPVYPRKGRRISALLWCLNSGIGSSEPSGYGWIRSSQVNWFRATSERLKTQTGPPITQLAFFHIPFAEYQTIWDYRTCSGYKNEKVCMQGKSEGAFAAFVEYRVNACFVGHDHTNDYEGTIQDVELCYGRATGYRGYGKPGFQRGARVIKMRDGVVGFTTHIRLADGTLAERPVHKPEPAQTQR